MICHKPATIIVRARCMLKFKENPIIGLGVYEWSTFYEEHEMCIFVGVLAGSRYYDEYGNETELRRKIVEECSVANRRRFRCSLLIVGYPRRCHCHRRRRYSLSLPPPFPLLFVDCCIPRRSYHGPPPRRSSTASVLHRVGPPPPPPRDDGVRPSFPGPVSGRRDQQRCQRNSRRLLRGWRWRRWRPPRRSSPPAARGGDRGGGRRARHVGEDYVGTL